MLCVAWLIVVVVGTDSDRTVIHRTDALVLLSALFLLLAAFILAHIFTSHRRAGVTVFGRAPIGLVLLLFLFFPQSTVLYSRIAGLVQSDIVLFTVWNIVDIALGRIIIALLKRDETPLLPAPHHNTSPDHLK